jgi:hypothetical protein
MSLMIHACEYASGTTLDNIIETAQLFLNSSHHAFLPFYLKQQNNILLEVIIESRLLVGHI